MPKLKITKKEVYEFNGEYYDSLDDAKNAEILKKRDDLRTKVINFIDFLSITEVSESDIFTFIACLNNKEIEEIRRMHFKKEI